jgi:hypothetical protein
MLALVALVGCSSLSAGTGPQSLAGSDGQGIAQPLIVLAKAHLQEQLDVQSVEIRVQSVRPLSFPRPARRSGQGSHGPAPESPGYLITLTAGGSAFEYQGKILGTMHILWHERGSPPASSE